MAQRAGWDRLYLDTQQTAEEGKRSPDDAGIADHRGAIGQGERQSRLSRFDALIEAPCYLKRSGRARQSVELPHGTGGAQPVEPIQHVPSISHHERLDDCAVWVQQGHHLLIGEGL